MASDHYQISLEGLHYERRKLSALVLDPLQEIKDFMARNLRSEEVAYIVDCLRNAIRSDILRNVTDGEALIAILDLFYGRDNLRVLQRLLRKINCYDLLEILNEWSVSNNPVNTRVFRECGYFPLWIRIKNNFTWFSGNKTSILQAIRRLFRIPEITPGDPDYETLIYMGVSFGRNDLLIYVLAPLCARKYIRNSLGTDEVSLAFEHFSISGVYFARHSERNDLNDDLTATSFTSIDESVQGDHIKQSQDLNELHLPKSNTGFYNGTIEPVVRYFHAANSTQSSPGEVKKDLRVMRASIGYIDGTPSTLNMTPENKTVEPVRVVRPKLLYLDKEDGPKKRAGVMQERIIKKSVVKVEKNSQSFNNSLLQPEKSENNYRSELMQQNAREENYFPSGEDLIVPERKHARRGDWNSSNELTHMAEECLAERDINYKLNSTKSKSHKGSYVGEHRTEEDTNRDPGKAVGKKLYTSTATLQVNMGKKSTNCPGKPANGKTRKREVAAPLYMSEPGFNDVEQSVMQSYSPSKHKWNGDSSLYKEYAVLEDYYKEMVPEPEPGGTQQFYQSGEFYLYQDRMFLEETPKGFNPKVVNGSPKTPLYSPPEGFRDGPPMGSKLVKVETKFFEASVQQPLLLSADEDNKVPHDWNNSRLETERLQEIPRPATERDRSSDHYPAEYNQNRLHPVFVHPRPFLMKAESKLESEYEDSVFTDTESNMANSRFGSVLPPYLSPPEYNGTASRSPGKLSDDSISTDTFDHTYKSNLLSAASVSSICKEREMFLSREELQMSIRGLEDKEIERQMELCKDLMIAAKAGDEEEVKRTIEEGVDTDYQNEFGQSAMMVASWEGHLGIVEILLSADADPNLQEGFGKSALHEAALSGHHTIVHRLISGGAKINLTDEEHRTPLHYAAMRGKRRIVEVLLLFGADVTVLTKFGESAVELAYSYLHDDIVDLLMSSRDKKTRKEMESQIRKQKLRQLSSATSLPNLSKVSSVKELSRSRSRPDLRKKKFVCPIQ